MIFWKTMTVSNLKTIGVLALQGAFIEHIQHLANAVSNPEYSGYDFSFPEIKTSEALSKCDALIIPGGESTSISLIAERTGMLEPLMEFVKQNKPIWGTCAGLIFLSKQIVNGKRGQKLLGAIDIQVTRNAFGRQLDSFVADLDFSSFIKGLDKFQTVFIRAPVISHILSKNETSECENVINSENDYQNDNPIEILYKLEESGLIVAVKQGNKLGTSFHPELSSDCRFHKWFIDEFVLKP